MTDPIDDTTGASETPDLPTPGDLPTHEYREFRGGKSIAEIVQARAPSSDATGTTEPASEAEKAARIRDEAGRFTRVDGAQEPTKPTAGNPRHDPKARVSELKAEIAELAKTKGETQRERDAMTSELATLRAERDALKVAPVTEPDQKAPARPKFTYPGYEAWSAQAEHADLAYEDYIEERAVARVRHERQIEDADREQYAAAAARHAEGWQPFNGRAAAFKATHPDVDALLKNSPSNEVQIPMPVYLAVEDEIRTSEHGPALRYYLAQHPETTREIAGLSPAAAVRKLDTLITSPTAASTGTAAAIPPKTQAAAPLEPVGSTPTASTRSLGVVAKSGSSADYRRLREAGVKP